MYTFGSQASGYLASDTCFCNSTGKRVKWGCGYISSIFSKYCSRHGGCTDGSETIRCVCEAGKNINLTEHFCTYCNKYGITYYKNPDGLEGKKCHCCGLFVIEV